MPQETNAGNITTSGNGPSSDKLIPFLSYTKINRTVVREFAEKLKAEGWIDPWFDEEDILPGQVWQESVTIGVRNSHAVIIFLSKLAVISEGFFQKEIKLALDTAAEKPEGTIFIIPIRLNDCAVPEMLQKYQYVDYFGNEEHKDHVYASLIASLKWRAQNLGIKV
ncbi:MAG: toll/interleukin-1 receptor domain-containing protein [Anaerolineales bacterium]